MDENYLNLIFEVISFFYEKKKTLAGTGTIRQEKAK
jgi:hypothetical protein